MRLLRPTTLEDDGFTIVDFAAIDAADFQRYHAEVYGAFEPGEGAQNKLARGTRWGVLAREQFIWLDRNTYSLPKEFNAEEGGRVRRFGLIPEAYLRRVEVERMLRQIFARWSFTQTSSERAYEVQLSAIRYEPTISTTAIPSPITPHQDLIDGAVVVMAKSRHLLGGTSRLYSLTEQPLYEVDLAVGEALLIRDARLKHQVTPILLAPDAQWRPGQRACRDILIVRFQPLGR
jgi:hypothetical protein